MPSPRPSRGGSALSTRAPSSSVGLSGQAWALGPPRRSADCATRRGGRGPLWWAEREAGGLGGCGWAEHCGGPWVYPRSLSRSGHARGARGPERAHDPQRAASPWWEQYLGPTAAERSLGDGGAAATRPEAPRAGKPGGPGTRRGPGTAGTPPTPPGEPSLKTASRPQSPSVFPIRLPASGAAETTHRVVPHGRPPIWPCAPLPRVPAAGLPSVAEFRSLRPGHTGFFQPVLVWMSTLGRTPAPFPPAPPPVGSPFLWRARSSAGGSHYPQGRVPPPTA